MNRILSRSIFYLKNKEPKKLYSDNRDAYTYMNLFYANEDCLNQIRFYAVNFKYQFVAWGLIFGYAYFYLKESWRMKELFEINYLNQQPVKEYEPEDYDYKFWELVRTKKTSKGEILINSDTAVKEKYLLIYLAKTTDSGLSMQRFSRLQKYITMRKSVPLDSVFIGLDEDIDPEVLDEYVENYDKNITAAYPQNPKIRESLAKVFLNIGCIYLIERQTGNVLSIVDPQKHPLEAMGKKFIFIISKNMDFRISQEVIKKELNFKSGKDEELSDKLPLY